MAFTARLPDPVTDEWDWQRHAACRGMDVTAFFHPRGERGVPWREREERAKRVCAQCPVRRECLDYSMSVEEPFGTWGGVGERERWAIVQQRRRAADRDRPPRPGRHLPQPASSTTGNGVSVVHRQRRGPRV